MTIALRPMLPADVAALAELFRVSIINLAEEDYSEDQLTAWAERAEQDDFGHVLTQNLTLLATKDRQIAGFATLKNDSIAMLYVHPHFARGKVATTLIDALERLAAARKVEILRVDASETAYPLFFKRGYVPTQRNSVPLGEVWLANTTMTKTLLNN